MIAFLDSSVLLRLLFSEPEPLAEWSDITSAYASHLLGVEVSRVIDRRRLQGTIDDQDVSQLHQSARQALRSVEVLAVTSRLLDLAAKPMPTSLGTLDAIHLTTALELARTLDEPLVLATHDLQLARAARASGLDVRGA